MGIKKRLSGFTPLEIGRKKVMSFFRYFRNVSRYCLTMNNFLQKRRRRFLSQAAFTFVELMIAITIFAIVALVIYSSFNASIKVWRRGEESTAINQNLRIALDDFAKELTNALSYTKDDDPEIYFEGKVDSIRFPVYLSLEKGGQFGIVTYRKEISSEKEEISLKREEKIFGQTPPEPEILIDKIDEVKFLYVFDTGDPDNPYEWRESWETKSKIPRGVKLTLRLQNGISFTKIVFIPTGELVKLP